MSEDYIYIRGNVPSSKNSKQWTGKTLIMSETVRKYNKNYGYQYDDPENIKKFKKMIEHEIKPLKIGFYFIRDSRRKFDYVNIAQYPLDMMVKNGWIDDDNAEEVIPIFLGYKVDKLKSGMIIKICK
ncbi:crossover junction endodeoxyribonuclease RusA [Sneathia vaginalis]|uniref:Crossover junction endodeoxyribonuclease RusA n=1 Tax=Sneathia vaginalis TaxID=187101 RepID=A0A0E3ZAW3_9FUSO|nr:crossover junction endodeoxyribonuclease RusA [Sneathia vaginalis]